MVIGNKEYEQVIITDNENNVLASITDENIIEENSCKVVMIRKEIMTREECEAEILEKVKEIKKIAKKI